MALSGLDIYKLLPKTNCKECGVATCLAFAMQLAKKAVSVEKCPYVSAEAKVTLDAASQPPIKLVTIGNGENKLSIGNETVMFRHEEKFRNPCGIGFIIEDSELDAQIKEKINLVNSFNYERVGQKLDVNLIAVKNVKDKNRFVEVVKLVSSSCKLAVVLISSDTAAIKEALVILKDKKPLVYGINKDNLTQVAPVIKEFNVPVVVSADDLDGLSSLSTELSKQGMQELVLDTGKKAITKKIWDLTQIRRLALKKSHRALGYPSIVIVEENDSFDEIIAAGTFLLKYSGIVLLKSIEQWQVYSLLTLRQNIYTDPQKPLQIEAKIYEVGQVTPNSPVLITTNFSLTYYTVLGEVEASKVPAYILTIDTEGMSVLTAWAADKFTPEKIANWLVKIAMKDKINHSNLVIPGYVAVISGELEEKSGWKIIVGPKEASGLPSFLKNYKN